MNKGSELIIVWFMNQNGFPDEFTDAFLDALYTGCEKGEGDAISQRDNLVAQAMSMDHGKMKDAIQAAFELHNLKIALKRDQAAIDAHRKIDEALADNPQSVLGKRIVAMKVKGILADFEKASA
ncbi:hypothetical protein O9X98_04930 [Agrobacterium salinitolerans]|nr:hypothetical protein [Agrobacterium salinitolerans]